MITRTCQKVWRDSEVAPWPFASPKSRKPRDRL